MSSNKITVNGNELDISGVDVFFVFECLKNLDSDRQINLTQVAETLGYSNVASVGNRLRSLKKRYGFANFEGRTAAAAAKAASTTPNGETSANSVKHETESAIAPGKKKGRPGRANTAEPDGNANGMIGDTTNTSTNGHSTRTTNGTSTNGEKKPSSKRKRNGTNEDDASAEQTSTKPAKRARGRGRGRQKATTPARSTDGGRATKEVVEVNAEANCKAATSGPTETVDPPLDMEELTETVRKMRRPADRIFLLAFETIKEARRERRLRQEGPKTGLKIRFKKPEA